MNISNKATSSTDQKRGARVPAHAGADQQLPQGDFGATPPMGSDKELAVSVDHLRPDPGSLKRRAEQLRPVALRRPGSTSSWPVLKQLTLVHERD